jgi:hypothetical protein
MTQALVCMSHSPLLEHHDPEEMGRIAGFGVTTAVVK